MRAALLAFGLLPVFATAGPAPIQQSPVHVLTRDDVVPWLDGFLPYALERGDVAGAVAVVVKDGEVLALRGYGHADVAKGRTVDAEQTLFRTGSVGKLFTWTAVMQLVESGRLDLDRDVNDYLDFRIPPRDGKPVTLRNLMTHTPGFEEAIKRLVTDRPERLPTLEHYVKAWTPARIFPPGEVPAYSNYGVALAGYLVERVSGESYDEYIERHVFGPLNMTHSTTRQPLPARLNADMSQGYVLGSGPPQPFELFAVSPSGGASTTGPDMARFMIAYLQGGQFGSSRILRPETVRQIFGTRLPIVPPLNSMLLGFFEENLEGRRIVGHRGDSQFFHSTLNLFVDQGVGVYLVVNSTGRGDAAIALPTAFVGEFADRYFPVAAVATAVPGGLAAEHARQMTGTYMSSRRQDTNFFSLLNLLTQMKVTLDPDGGLRVSSLPDLNGQPIKWREASPYVWQQVGGKERLAARVDHGQVSLLSLDSVSPFLVMQRVPWWKSSALLLPLLVFAIAAILVTIIAWPACALLRRRQGAAPALAEPELHALRAVHLAAMLALAALLAWAGLFGWVSSNLFAFSPELDSWIRVLKLSTLVACVSGTTLALWNARFAWTRPRGWGSRAGSSLLVIAFATLLWIALVFRLAGFGTDY